MSQPTLQHLIAFRAVADHGGFSAAADELRMSQPAVSQQIRALEQLLGVALFERRPRGTVLTTAGESLLPLARAGLDSVDAFAVEAERQRSGLTRLRIAAIPTIAPYLFPRVISTLRSTHPSSQLFISEQRTTEIVAGLQHAQLDLAFIATDEDSDDIASLAIGADPFLLAVASDDGFADYPLVSAADLLQREVLLLQDGHCIRGQALAVCASAGAATTHDVSASSLSTVCQMVAAGQGVTLLPQLAVAVECRPGSGITAVPLMDGSHARTLRIAWRRTSPHAPEFEALASELRASFVPSQEGRPESRPHAASKKSGAAISVGAE